MIFNKKKLIVPVAIILLLISFHTASAFSFGKFFKGIFGSNKVEETQPASSFSATKEDDTKQVTPPEEIKTIDPPVVVDPTPTKDPEPTPLPPVKIDPSIKPIITPPAPKDPTPEDDQIVIKYGMRGNTDVRTAQTKLKILNYFNGKVDGNYGKITVSAIKDFKDDYNISGDGYSMDKPAFKALLNAKVKKIVSTSCANYQYITQWGTNGSGNGQFNQPYDVTTDSANNVYVADAGNYRIEKFSPNGSYINQFGVTNLGPDSGISINRSTGDIYVAYEAANTIVKYDSNGQYLTQWGIPGSGNLLYVPYRVAPNSSSGDVYVSNSYDGTNYDSIVKYTSNGQYLSQWGTPGTGNSQFHTPYGVAIDSLGNVYVADQFNHRIQKFTSNGTYITQWGTPGSGNGQFNFPTGVAIDSSNDIYVTDSGNARIQKFTSDGLYITQWGTNGTGNSQFRSPLGISVDALGYVYVADTSNDRIQKFGCATQTTPTLTVSLASSTPPAQTVQAGATNVHLADFDLTASSSMLVNRIVIGVGDTSLGDPTYTYLRNVRLEVANSPVGPITVAVPTDSRINFTPILPFGGDTKKISIYADIIPTTPNNTKIRSLVDLVNVTDPSVNVIYPDYNNGVGWSNFVTVTNQPSSECYINSFNVPASTSIASRLSIPVSWSSNCNNVVLEANSGSYTLRYTGGGSGTHTFVAPATGTVFSNADSAVDITLIAGNNSDDTVSNTKSVSISDIPSPASNQCPINSLTATPNPVSLSSPQTTLSWQASAGCIVYVESWIPTANGLISAHVFKPGTYYFNATDSVNVTLTKSTTYYVSAQAGPGSLAVLSAKTIDVKMGTTCDSTTPPSITVLSPNGGETFQIGGNMPVQWTTCNIPTNTNIWLQIINQNSSFVIEPIQIVNDGDEIISLPFGTNPGFTALSPGNYKINLIATSALDESDAPFTILPWGCNSTAGYSATTGQPCWIGTTPAEPITANSWTLKGMLLANAPRNVYFEYWFTNPSNLISTPVILQPVNGLFSATLPNLISGTTYNFKACDTFNAGTCGEQLSFTP